MTNKPEILIVDDDKAIVDSLSRLFKDNGFTPAGAYSGNMAFELAKSNLFDLIILDLGLPDIDGLELYKTLKQARVTTPVIILSGQATISKAIEAIRLGAFNIIEKPPDPEKLLLDCQIAIKQRSLENEVNKLRGSLLLQNDFVGESEVINALREKLIRVAVSDSRAYIHGEPGVGKEMAARFLHFSSSRATGPFVAVNCAAIPGELFESELFGHEKGAFTGAVSLRKGKFEIADGGSLFLDEVAELRTDHQAKLLRVIETSLVQRLGSSREFHVDLRIISASNKELQKETQAGRFREDLYFRLNVIPVFVPPLRDRLDDIPLLARHFLDKLGYDRVRLEASALSALSAHRWPGNVRELRNIIERSAALAYGDKITEYDINGALGWIKTDSSPAEPVSKIGPLSLKEHANRFEKSLLQDIMRETDGNITKAAQLLKMDRGNLSKKLKKYGLS
jgi:two-component system, NtrC family, nitrogen regulation response regulator NtrX